MANVQNSFEVISNEQVFAIVKQFKNHLESLGVPIQTMYLYGSYSKGKARYGSDIDICVISPVFQDRLESNLLLRREAIKINSRIEPVGYSSEQFEDWIPLVWEIKTNGTKVPLD